MTSAWPIWFANTYMLRRSCCVNGNFCQYQWLCLEIPRICRCFNSWADDTLIMGNERAEGIVRQTRAWLFEFCDWRLLQPHDQDSPVFNLIRKTALRIDGFYQKTEAA